MKHKIAFTAGLALAANADAAIMFSQTGVALIGSGATVVIWSGFGAGTATNFTFSFGYNEPVPDSSWASDMLIELSAPNGASVTIGGYATPGDFIPSYDGPGSNPPGVYGDSIDISGFGLSGAGTWTMTMTNDWDLDVNPNEIGGAVGSAIVEELHPFMGIIDGINAPTPGTLSLMGVAAMTAARRRRAD